jgi:hypothetical protein
MVEQLFSHWANHRGLTSPPPDPIQLWEEGGRSVWIANAWGPAVPYHPVDHGNGCRNYGYARTKGDPQATARIPELEGWQELQDFLLAVNAAESPIESVGCEKALFPSDVDGPTVKLGAYIDMIFTNLPLNDAPENLLLLAGRLLPCAAGCEKWWSYAEVSIQRLRGLAGTVAPWGLMLRVAGYGRTQEEARKWWGETMSRFTKAVAALPKDLAWQGQGGNG